MDDTLCPTCGDTVEWCNAQLEESKAWQAERNLKLLAEEGPA